MTFPGLFEIGHDLEIDYLYLQAVQVSIKWTTNDIWGQCSLDSYC